VGAALAARGDLDGASRRSILLFAKDSLCQNFACLFKVLQQLKTGFDYFKKYKSFICLDQTSQADQGGPSKPLHRISRRARRHP
jgi:hypothetical protein